MLKKAIIATLSCFSLVLQAASFSYSHQTRRLTIVQDKQTKQIVLPESIIDVENDGRYIYFAKKRSIQFVLANDAIGAEGIKDISLLPSWEIDLSKDLGKKEIANIAVHMSPLHHLIHVATKDSNDEFSVTTFAIRKASRNAEPMEEDQAEVAKNDVGLYALKQTETNFPGSAEITTITAPDTGAPILLSMDQEKGIVHSYDISPDFKPIYREAFQISTEEMKNPKFVVESSQSTVFEIKGESKKHSRRAGSSNKMISLSKSFSYYELQAKASLLRAKVLIELENEITGNAWMKNFFFWGLYSNVIDFVDDLYGNPEVTADDLIKDPVLANLYAKGESLSTAEKIKHLTEYNVFTEEEANKYLTDNALEQASGRKWMVTVLIVIGLIKVYKFTSKTKSSTQAFRHFGARLGSLGTKLRNSNTLVGRGLGYSADKLKAMSIKLNGRLVKNFYNMEYPIHALHDFRKKLRKAKIITFREAWQMRKLPYAEQFQILQKLYLDNADTIAKLDNVPLKSKISDLFGKFLFPVSRYLNRLRPKHVDSFYDDLKLIADKLRGTREVADAKNFPTAAKFDEIAKLPLEEKAVELMKVFNENISLFKNIDDEYLRFSIAESSKKVANGVDALTSTFKPTASTGTQIQNSMKNLELYIRNTEITQELRKIKALQLARLAKSGEPQHIMDLRSDKALGFINASDPATISAKINQMEELVKLGKISQASFDHISKRIRSLIKELAEVEEKIAKTGSSGKVAPIWDKWASVSQAYARFFLSNKLLFSDNRVMRFLNTQSRADAVMTSNGLQPITITGYHAKSAFWLGVTDTAGEVVSQTVARSSLVDPNEHSIGSGDNHIEIFSVGEKEYGIHFDLLNHVVSNLTGWWLSMPLGLAKMGMSFGSKGKVTLSERFFDSMRKGFNPVNYLYGMGTLGYPILWLGQTAIKEDYKQDHADDFDQKAYEEFEAKISNRLTSIESFAERKFLGVTTSAPTVNPQFNMQADFDNLAKSMFNSTAPGQIVSNLVMPLTTGFFPNRWYGQYFGTVNAKLIELLKNFQLDGLMEKTDDEGLTDIASWTDQEKVNFVNMMIALETAKKEKTNPLSEVEDINELSAWYAEVGRNLFGDNIMNQNPEDLPSKVTLAAEDADMSEYEEAIESINAKFKEMRERTTVLPFIKTPADNSAMVARATDKELSEGKEFVELTKITEVQSKLIDALSLLKDNRNALTKQQRTQIAVIVYDGLFLVNTLFTHQQIKNFGINTLYMSTLTIVNLTKHLNNPRILNPDSIAGRSANALGKSLNGILTSTPLILASIPLYLWIDGQMDAHVNMENHITTLISELQEVLFSMTQHVAKNAIAHEIEGYTNVENLNEYREAVDKKQLIIERLIMSAKEGTDRYMYKRYYRIPSILAASGPAIMGISGLWILSHYAFYKASNGFVKKMTDNFAPGLFKYGFIAWLTMSGVSNIVDKNMQMHSIDFVNLYSSYTTATYEKYLIDGIIEAREKGLDIDAMENYVLQKLDNDENFTEVEEFKNKLMELSSVGE